MAPSRAKKNVIGTGAGMNAACMTPLNAGTARALEASSVPGFKNVIPDA